MRGMHRNTFYKSWLTGLLVLFAAGCCDSTKIGATLPTVVTMSPVVGATGACPNTVVTASFSEAMNPSTINDSTFTLSGPGSTGIAGQVTYNTANNTAMFTPVAPLAVSVTYTATITTGARDLYGNALTANVSWQFTTAANGCNPPPNVTSVTPPNGTAGVCPNTVVTASFSQAMNQSTINGSTFTLSGAGLTNVAGQVTYNATNNTAMFTPTAPLTVSVTYTATITTGVQDIFGNALGANVTWQFTTAANGCNPPPTLTSVTPPNGTTGVCPNRTVAAFFSEAMKPSSINAANFTLTGPGSTVVPGQVSYVSQTNSAVFTPSAALALSTNYTATITTGVEDLFGNFLANNFSWTFTTGASSCVPPTVTAVTFANGSTGDCPNKVLTAVFSSAMNPLTINPSTFTLSGPSGSVTGQVSYDAATNTAIFTPPAALALSTLYTATITTGAQDTFGVPLASNYVWTFTTGQSPCVPPPPPVSVTPPNGSTGVCSSALVSATFPNAMDPTSVNATTFTLTGPGTTAVAGTIVHDAANKMFTFTPTDTLALSTTFTATLTTGVTDSFGNALASNYVWSFTTAATACGSGSTPTVIAVSPAAGAMGVCLDSVISATFSEQMDPTTINSTTFTLTPPELGTVALDSTGRIATFTPSADLPVDIKYTATITTGAKDLSGNPLASNYTWSFTTATQKCQPPVQLGTAANFEILAGTTVTNTGPTIVTGGNLGLSPGSAVTGFPPGTLTSPAVMHITDAVAAQAQLDLTTAYNYTAGLTGGAVLPTEIGGLTFTPGLYSASTAVNLTAGNVTLDAQGNANAVFIFQVDTALTTLGSTSVILANGAQAKNVFWQIGSSATLGTSSVFEGTIMAYTSITLDNGATLNGRALASNGAVTLDTNSVNAP